MILFIYFMYICDSLDTNHSTEFEFCIDQKGSYKHYRVLYFVNYLFIYILPLRHSIRYKCSNYYGKLVAQISWKTSQLIDLGNKVLLYI